MESPEKNIIDLAAHRENKIAAEKEKLGLIKSEIDGLFFDFFPTYSTTNLIWFDMENHDPNTISCQLLEDDFTPTENGIVIDFANYINAHKPSGMHDYQLVSAALEETPPNIVFKRQR